MVNPVTGPFTKTETVLAPATPYGRAVDINVSRTWKRQKRPYNLPLDYTFQRGQVVSRVYHPFASAANWNWNDDEIALPTHNSATVFPETYNLARARFADKLMADSAGLALAFAQRKQSLDMISTRALQIASFANLVRKGQLSRAAKAIGWDTPPNRWLKSYRSGKGEAKKFANVFLEAHFGWSPLVRDIYACVDILQNGVPGSRVTASAKSSRNRAGSRGTRPSYHWQQTVTCAWKMGADVRVSNPNLFLANQLGLVNPALVAYDAVPFSFVLNWFVTLEDFLSGFTDFWGLELLNPYTTLMWMCHTTKWENQYNWRPGEAVTEYRRYRFAKAHMSRRAGAIPGPTLRLRAPWRLSPLRGLTSVSLLIQKLR